MIFRALVLVLLALGPAFAVSSPTEMLPDPAQEKRAEAIGQQLRCMVCQNESIEDSDADLARDLRRIIRQHVVAGETDQQVMDWAHARYGDFVRLNPPFKPLTWLLWFSPVVALAVGIVAAILGRRRRAAMPNPLSPAESETLSHLLER